MRTVRLRSGVRRNRGDSSLLALLLIACLVCIVIFLKWYLKSSVQDPDLHDYPEAWKEWSVREKSKKPAQGLSAEQPDISEGIKFDTNLSDKESKEPRGEMVLFVGVDGGVAGSWNGFYHKGRTRSFQIMNGGFGGRVYPAKIHRNESGEEDPSMLYLMAKGEYLVLETDTKKGRVERIAGDIYVRGWLSPDYVMTGEITITSFGNEAENFTCKSYGQVHKGGLLF
jgi:hypothetical protein